MKKKFVSISLCLAMAAVSLAGCGLKEPEAPATTAAPAATEAAKETEAAGSEAATQAAEAAGGEKVGPDITLVMAEVNPLDTIVGQTDTAFKEKVEELSGGSIKIDLQASGVLGSENDVLDTMLGGGDIDMSRISAFALTSYGGQKSMLLSIPYTFVSREHFWNFATSPLAEEFLLEPQENGAGVRGLFYGEEGFRHFFTVKEIHGLEDLKGMKLRVSNDPIMNGMVEGLGASPTVVSFGELYSALQTGVVDGAENGYPGYDSNKFYEVAPYYLLDAHTFSPGIILMAEAQWNKLSPEDQAILLEAGKKASEWNKAAIEEEEKALRTSLEGKGVTIIECPPEDIAAAQEACKSVWAGYTEGIEDLLQKIVDIQQ